MSDLQLFAVEQVVFGLNYAERPSSYMFHVEHIL